MRLSLPEVECRPFSPTLRLLSPRAGLGWAPRV